MTKLSQINVSKNIVSRLQIKFAGETVYDNNAESLYEVYKDLWKTKIVRNNMPQYGIAVENLRILISKDDRAANSGDAAKVSNALVYAIHGTKQNICILKVLADHGLHAPYAMNNDFQYILTLARASDIMVAQGGQAVTGHTLENMQLEYEKNRESII